MSYSKKAKQGLISYKESKYPNVSEGTWKGIPYSHILKVEDSAFNLIKDYRDKFFQSRFAGIKKHIYFHHLNSSQAMCINFFFPLIAERTLSLILEYLKIDDEVIDYNSIEFEKTSQIDSKNGHRPTNFDFYFKTENEKKFYFGIKYTENGFGKATNDSEHLKKYEDIYQHHLSVISPKYANSQTFLQRYQIFRNLIHIDENSYVIFLYPKANLAVAQEVESVFSKNVLKDEYKSHLKPIHWEDILKMLPSDSPLSKYYKEFSIKYSV